MGKNCVLCGKENEKYICNNCKKECDIENLCNEIIRYTPLIQDNTNCNPIWDKIASGFDYSSKFKSIAYEIAEELESPRKEFVQIYSLAGEYTNVSKDKREWLLSIYDKIIKTSGLTQCEKNRVKGLVLDALYSEYRYSEADCIASELLGDENLPYQAIKSLADFYIKTRRYDEAECLIAEALTSFSDENVLNIFRKLQMDCEKYKTYAENGKKEYMPNPRDNKDKAISNYIAFLSSIGIDVKVPVTIPKPIPKEKYPEANIITEPDFESFVAYDLETTGLSSTMESIIEIGAVKVINGEVVESKEYIFNEFVKPFKRKLSPEITSLTGITKDDLKDARQMWEVVKDFMEFVGDNVLVGYNNATFDSKFLARAGRYANIYINNPQFDVYKYIISKRDKIGFNGENCKLTMVAEYYGIEKTKAHRAWADALTTARVYMKIKECQ